MTEAIGLMREAFADLSSGAVDVPVRMSMTIKEHGARALFMPVYSASKGQIAQKVVTVHPRNGRFGLPFIHALVLLIDAACGKPLAIMDGEFITALRTGAGSGLATELLARRDAEAVAIFGAGVQARTQLQAVSAVRRITRVLIFGRSPDNAARFAQEVRQAYDAEVLVAHDPALLLEADVVCTATTSLDPVFADEHIVAGCHINGVGSYRPDMTEIPPETIGRATVFVDQRTAALEEAGDLIVPLDRGLIDPSHVRGELGEVAVGTVPGRTCGDQVTLFKSVGSAAQDLAIASHAYIAAVSRDLGTVVQL